MNVLFDTNVLLDVLARRQPFYMHSARVFALVEKGQLEGSVSTLSLANIFYVTRRLEGAQNARRAVRIVRNVFTLVSFDPQIASLAIDSEMADFEDAIQYFSAVRAGAACLLTRNPKDFPVSGVGIQTPTEFLGTHFPGQLP